MKLYIKFMVSLRCKMLVKEELEKLGLHYVVLDLGMVDVLEEISEDQRELLKKTFENQVWSFWMIKKVSSLIG